MANFAYDGPSHREGWWSDRGSFLKIAHNLLWDPTRKFTTFYGRRRSIPSSGPLWSPPIAVDPAELNPTILRQFGGCGDRRDFKAYLVQVFADRIGPPEGLFEIAFNGKSRRACAIYEAVSDMNTGSDGQKMIAATDPIWVSAVSPQSAVNAIFETLVEQGEDEYPI